jgi:hypothetical protein
MPLNHLLWRLVEGKTAALSVVVSCRCRWPSCPIQTLDFIIRLLEPRAPKPEEASCPICRREMTVLSARALPNSA